MGRIQDSIETERDSKRSFTPVHVEPHPAEAVCQDHIFEDDNVQPVTKIVMQWCVPLIRVRAPDVEMTQFHRESRDVPIYVAISHVRSQGLGNTEHNALPMCQLSRLQKLVDDLHLADRQSAYFWIDTACIPHTQPGKSMAFELLNTVYRRAAVVLALDSTLQSMSISSARDNLLAIGHSAWFRRLWTVREGALAPCIRFQLKDGSVSFDDIIAQFTATQADHAVEVGTATVDMDDRHRVQEKRAREEPLLDALCLFERDQRVYLGRAVGTRRDPSREACKDPLRTLLAKGYRSTSRYELFSTPADAVELAVLRQTIEKVYSGLTYNDLVAEQESSVAGTIQRINRVKSLQRSDR